MRISILVILTVVFFNLNLNGQTRTIIGRVICENLEPLPGLDIEIPANVHLGKTDMDGRFKISVPQDTDSLLFRYAGMEYTDIRLTKDCDTVEVVMMYSVLYDFNTLKKADRLRKKRFDNLPNLHSDAVINGLFVNTNICYERAFEEYNPPKSVIDSITKDYKLRKKQIKDTFKGLAIGDTIRIPYYGTPKYDGTGKTTMNPYSFTYDDENFEYIIQGVITDKNKRKDGYYIVYRVIDCVDCHYDKMILNNKELKDGELIDLNMRYIKTLDNK